MKKFIKHCLTGKDNAGWTVFHSGAFDAQGYGAGFGLAMGGGGIGVWAKSGTEPEAKQAEND